MRMQKCDGGSIAWNEGIAEPSQFSYEAILAHEMGHAGYAMPDSSTNWGMMFGNVATGPSPDGLHLYPIDQRTAFSTVNTAESRQATFVDYDWNSFSWSSALNQSAGIFPTFAPGVSDHRGTLFSSICFYFVAWGCATQSTRASISTPTHSWRSADWTLD